MLALNAHIFVSHYFVITVAVRIGCQGNLCTGTTGKTAGKQHSAGAHQQRLEHLPGKEEIVFSKVCKPIKDIRE